MEAPKRISVIRRKSIGPIIITSAQYYHGIIGLLDDCGINRQIYLQICPSVDRTTDQYLLKKDRDRRFLDRSRFASSSFSGATTLIFDRHCGVLIRVVSIVIVGFDN